MIILSIQHGSVFAQFDMQQPDRADVIRLFGTDTLPTPYSSASDRAFVIREITRLNPGSVIKWE